MYEQPKRKSALDDEKIELFISEVIRKNLLPNAKFTSASAIGAAGADKFSYASVDLSNSFANYRKSNYYFDGDYKFIHYTSVPKLLSIIRDKKIRLYDLRAMDDKDEFDFGHKVLNKKSSYLTNEAKKRIFCLSMCNYELEDKEQSLNMWRQFGLDGHGVGIVLEFEKSNRSNWIHYILSRVHYGEQPLKKLYKTYEVYAEFSNKYNFTIRNFDEFLYKLFCFHKQHIYKDEKEVRLIYNRGFRTLQPTKGIADLNSKLKKSSYHELELEWDRWKTFTGDYQIYQERAKTIYPYVTIDKIIFGYRISNPDKWNIVDTVTAYKSNYNKFPTLENSTLLKYFQDIKEKDGTWL
jgi:hypothetical protein